MQQQILCILPQKGWVFQIFYFLQQKKNDKKVENSHVGGQVLGAATNFGGVTSFAVEIVRFSYLGAGRN